MSHLIREYHLDDLCANCAQPHGSKKEILNQHHKIYEMIKCQHCEYKIIRLQQEKKFNDRLQVFDMDGI